MKRILFAAAAAMLVVTPALAHEYEIGNLTIEHPWSRATPAGAGVGAGYLVVSNAGDSSDRLVGATTAVSDRVEIHEMGMSDGVMTMRPLADGLEVPAQGEVTLEPGGYHIMFMQLAEPLVEGERFTATLEFQNAGAVEVEFTIESIGADAAHHDDGAHDTHDHDSHDHEDHDHGGHGSD